MKTVPLRDPRLDAALGRLSNEQIGGIVARVAREGNHQGDCGNCANFAVVLGRVLGAGGEYVIADGEHYEYANHVAVVFRGAYFDSSGLVTDADLLAYADEEEEESVSVLPFPDPSPEGALVRRLADDDAVFAANLDEAQLEADLVAAFVAAAPDVTPSDA